MNHSLFSWLLSGVCRDTPGGQRYPVDLHKDQTHFAQREVTVEQTRDHVQAPGLDVVLCWVVVKDRPGIRAPHTETWRRNHIC